MLRDDGCDGRYIDNLRLADDFLSDVRKRLPATLTDRTSMMSDDNIGGGACLEKVPIVAGLSARLSAVLLMKRLGVP